MTEFVTLADCPPGLFMFGETLGFKSEYKSPSTHVPGGYKVDAYVVESVEFFWGGTRNPREREVLLVQPIEYKPARETSASITAWAAATFGEAGSDARVAARANEEMAELLRAATSDQPIGRVIEEAADVVVILCRLAGRNGVDLWAAVEDKMEVNRARTWQKDGTGHGYHVREKSE